MDQYEVRTWTAWHRFVTLCMVAHALLVVLRAQVIVAMVGRGSLVQIDGEADIAKTARAEVVCRDAVASGALCWEGTRLRRRGRRSMRRQRDSWEGSHCCRSTGPSVRAGAVACVSRARVCDDCADDVPHPTTTPDSRRASDRDGETDDMAQAPSTASRQQTRR